MKPHALQFFPDTASTIAYLGDELLASLRSDLAENEDDPGEADTCAELQAKIDDIELVHANCEAIPGLDRLLRIAELYDDSLNLAEQAPTGEDYNKLFAIITEMRTALGPVIGAEGNDVTQAATSMGQSSRKFFKTTYTVVILSEETPASGLSLEEAAYAIGEGDCVGEFSDDSGVPLTGLQAANALSAVGSTPDFFKLTEHGADLDENDED